MARRRAGPARRKGRRGPSPYTRFALLAAAIAALTGAVWAVAVRDHWYAGWLLAVSAATFALYGLDKHQARNGGLRVPENVLHVLALAGGAAGGWAGMLFFRHKTRHGVFYVVLAVASALQIGLALWLATSGQGRP
jgi:uncharacterized membrane protein YsdA (DUF1294 family)